MKNHTNITSLLRLTVLGISFFIPAASIHAMEQEEERTSLIQQKLPKDDDAYKAMLAGSRFENLTRDEFEEQFKSTLEKFEIDEKSLDIDLKTADKKKLEDAFTNECSRIQQKVEKHLWTLFLAADEDDKVKKHLTKLINGCVINITHKNVQNRWNSLVQAAQEDDSYSSDTSSEHTSPKTPRNQIIPDVDNNNNVNTIRKKKITLGLPRSKADLVALFKDSAYENMKREDAVQALKNIFINFTIEEGDELDYNTATSDDAKEKVFARIYKKLNAKITKRFMDALPATKTDNKIKAMAERMVHDWTINITMKEAKYALLLKDLLKDSKYQGKDRTTFEDAIKEDIFEGFAIEESSVTINLATATDPEKDDAFAELLKDTIKPAVHANFIDALPAIDGNEELIKLAEGICEDFYKYTEASAQTKWNTLITTKPGPLPGPGPKPGPVIKNDNSQRNLFFALIAAVGFTAYLLNNSKSKPKADTTIKVK